MWVKPVIRKEDDQWVLTSDDYEIRFSTWTDALDRALWEGRCYFDMGLCP